MFLVYRELNTGRFVANNNGNLQGVQVRLKKTESAHSREDLGLEGYKTRPDLTLEI